MSQDIESIRRVLLEDVDPEPFPPDLLPITRQLDRHRLAFHLGPDSESPTPLFTDPQTFIREISPVCGIELAQLAVQAEKWRGRIFPALAMTLNYDRGKIEGFLRQRVESQR